MRASLTNLSMAFLCVLLACGGDDTATVRVDIRTDWVPIAEFSEIEVSVDDGGSETYDATFDDDFLGGVRVASLEGVAFGERAVRARMLGPDGRRLAQRLVTVNVTGATTVTLVFTRACESVECPAGDQPSATECLGGRCVEPECTPETPEACGEAQCEADADCPRAPVGCARSICAAGTCFVGSDFSACGPTEYCNPNEGCTARPTGSDLGTTTPPDMGTTPLVDGGPVDGGPIDQGPAECGEPCDTGDRCEVGVFDCASGSPVCVRDRLREAGSVCRPAAGACDVAEVCDGTTPACPLDAFEATGTACSEGFCDGLGACSDGCTPGASCSTGNPCEIGTVSCGSGSPVCQRSGNAPNGASCAATQNGAWGSCGGFSGACDEGGTRSRTVTSYACQSGACDPSTASETERCSRNTDGGSCGSVSYGSWGTCGGFADGCDTTGTRTRSVTTPICASGSCSSMGSTESGSCTRNTDGTTCGSVTYGGWSACGGFSSTCDETGTRSRSVTTPTCSSGSCGSMGTTETQSCTRSTGGTTCGSTTTGSWGICSGFSDGCDETGTRSRTDRLRRCASGACEDVLDTVNGSCTRSTAGQACPGPAFGCNNYSCSGGRCNAQYQCQFDQTCCDDRCFDGACP